MDRRLLMLIKGAFRCRILAYPDINIIKDWYVWDNAIDATPILGQLDEPHLFERPKNFL
ncbi:hypothetical protein SMG44B_60148 [Stenotrophomonas maltophilia]